MSPCPLLLGILGEGLLRVLCLGGEGVGVVGGERFLFWGPGSSIIMGPGAGLVLSSSSDSDSVMASFAGEDAVLCVFRSCCESVRSWRDRSACAYAMFGWGLWLFLGVAAESCRVGAGDFVSGVFMSTALVASAGFGVCVGILRVLRRL